MSEASQPPPNVIPLPPTEPFAFAPGEWETFTKENAETLVNDRDKWQRRCQELAFELQTTELALGKVIETNEDLVNGQQTLIAMLERARAATADSWSGIAEEIRKLLEDVTAVESTPEGLAVVRQPDPQA